MPYYESRDLDNIVQAIETDERMLCSRLVQTYMR